MNNPIKKKIEQSKNPSSLTKRQRRKKLSIIKDTLHRGLGKKMFKGMGELQPHYCDICKERIYKTIVKTIGKRLITYCEKCLDRPCDMCGKIDFLYPTHIIKNELPEYWCDNCIAEHNNLFNKIE